MFTCANLFMFCDSGRVMFFPHWWANTPKVSYLNLE